jgi:hypothetical protein
MMDYFSFKRPQQATSFCDSLEGKGIANARSGLFLVGPRRVGKSTFLKDDLIPEALQRGWVTVYVDLWADKHADCAQLIAEAIKVKIMEYKSRFTKLATAVHLDKINLMGTFALDFSKSGFPEQMTLTDALRILGELANKPVLLVIDEAQHALTTERGLNTMFAIKSARDQLNTPLKAPSLMLVFTGSNRDKLSHLVLKKDQPFFGADVTPFPLLNQGYTDKFTIWVNKNLSPDNQFTSSSMWAAFKLVGNRPEILSQIAGRIALSGEASHLAQLLEPDAIICQSRMWDEFEHDFNSLTPLQQAILTVLINKGSTWSPFSDESMTCYKQKTGQTEISTATIQTAIQSLRERGFVWQSGRGAYALEDDGFAEWFNNKYA